MCIAFETEGGTPEKSSCTWAFPCKAENINAETNPRIIIDLISFTVYGKIHTKVELKEWNLQFFTIRYVEAAKSLILS